MANHTDPLARQVHGTNPQNLVEKILRGRIYDSMYWKEQCFGLTAETVVEKAVKLDYVGGTYSHSNKPSPFICLVLKLLQIQPEKEIVIEYIKNEDFKYVRALGAFYLRLTGRPADVYAYLEPLYNDYRKLAHRSVGGWKLLHMDEFIDELLVSETCCDVTLPHLLKRDSLVQAGVLRPRESVLDDDLEDEGDGDAPLPQQLLSLGRGGGGASSNLAGPPLPPAPAAAPTAPPPVPSALEGERRRLDEAAERGSGSSRLPPPVGGSARDANGAQPAPHDSVRNGPRDARLPRDARDRSRSNDGAHRRGAGADASVTAAGTKRRGRSSSQSPARGRGSNRWAERDDADFRREEKDRYDRRGDAGGGTCYEGRRYDWSSRRERSRERSSERYRGDSRRRSRSRSFDRHPPYSRRSPSPVAPQRAAPSGRRRSYSRSRSRSSPRDDRRGGRSQTGVRGQELRRDHRADTEAASPRRLRDGDRWRDDDRRDYRREDRDSGRGRRRSRSRSGSGSHNHRYSSPKRHRDSSASLDGGDRRRR